MVDEKIIGEWEIIEMEDFDSDYVNAEGKAFIKIKENYHGILKFGHVSADLDGRVENNSVYRFMWEGNDELDYVHGDGVIEFVDSNRIEGEINFYQSDSYKFQATRKNTSNGKQ